MRRTTERHDRIVAVVLALSMLLSVGIAPVSAGVGGGQTAQIGPTAQATSISSCTTISAPGQYVLTNDITNSGASTCIRITASDVVFDGGGHVIEGVGDPGTRGVYVFQEAGDGEGITTQNVAVTNLGVTDWEEGIRFDRVANGVVDEVTAWGNEVGVRFAVLSQGHGVYGSTVAENEFGLVLDGGGQAEIQESVAEANKLGFEVNSDGNVIEANELVDNEYGVETYRAQETQIVGNQFEAHHSIGVHLRTGTTALVAENQIVGTEDALAGIWVESNENEVIENVVANTGQNAIAVATAEHNLVGGNQVESVENGLTLYSASENEFEANEVRDTEYAIRLEDGAYDNHFQDDDVAENGWAFSAAYDSTADVENLFVGDSTTPTTLSFDAYDTALRTVATPPSVPPSLDSLGKFVYTEPTSSNADLALSVHYTDQEAQQAGLDESRLRLWRHGGFPSSWSQIASPNSVDTTANTVTADVNDFGVVAPLATSAENVSRIGFDYGDYGGNLNVEVNGDFRNVGWFYELDGTTVGNASVTVTNATVSGGQQGTVEIVGSIESFSVGGQEMWLDNVEFGPAGQPRATVDFAILAPSQSQYVVGESFRSSPDNVSMTVEEFVWWDGTVYAGGEAIPTTNSPPMSGGSGQDMYPGNVNLRFDVGEIINGTSQP